MRKFEWATIRSNRSFEMKGRYLKWFLQLCWGKSEEVILLVPLFLPV
jgi:GTP-sensing pleiotropic transcriptional regulator CodY